MARRTVTLRVRRTRWLTPRMVRVVLAGPPLAGFPDTPFTDASVRLLFPRPGVAYPEPFDADAVRAALPRDRWPLARTYTVRAVDRVAGELVIDVVHHGPQGVAGPWAASARPGDVAHLVGPSGTYAPDPDAGWHLFAGDESALPAIAAACEHVRPDTPAVAVVEVEGPAEEQPLPGAVRVVWCHRDLAASDGLVEAVRALRFPAGRIDAFVHGEAGAVRAVRRHLLDERGIPRVHLSASGYWRRGRDEDGRSTGR